MCRRLICLISIVMMLDLVLTNGASAADPSLICWWKFDDGSGDTAKDSSGNGNDGTLMGNPQWVPGKLGGALAFGGDGSHVVDNDAGGYLNGLSDLTVSVWIKSNQTGTNAGFIHGVDPPVGQDRVFAMRYDSSGASFGGSNILKVGVVSDGGNQNLETSNDLQTTEWQHVAMTWTSGGLIEFYADGVQDTPAGRNNPNNGGTVSEVTSLLIGKGGKDEDATEGWDGLIDDVRIYSRVLSAEEIQQVMIGIPPGLASEPNPPNAATDVPRDLALGWNPGEFAVKHDVYLGRAFDDVNNADTLNTLGVLASQEQEATTYASGRLELGETYYWRVDEVNGAPDFAVLKGEVWSFSVERIANPVTNVTATASDSFGASVPENTINGSGLVDDLHGTSAGDMWISTGLPATIEYAFDRAYKLHEFWVWNSNQTIEAFIGFGAKDVVIEHSLDGKNWTVLDGVGPLAQASGMADYAHNNVIGFGGAVAQFVRMTVNSVQGFAPQASLSEVRFFSIPTFATRPTPDSGATNVAPDLLLSWGRNGREADSHDVYIGTDVNDLSLAGRVSESSFDSLAADLQVGQTYYWQVVEVNDAMDPMEWAGDVWSFTTVASIAIDDMESYKDEEFLEIWATWIDGFDDPANNGAIVGAVPSLGDFSPETDRVHGGSQSLPLHYDNSTAAQSEATRTFDTPMDWTQHGVASLVLYFQGSSTNT
ncbi:MAG: LamG domain-containing protein, partial [Planctomycetes bacterium]|nr:LamG domain-containing protein [Planctomycetota bacterium]